LPLNSDTHFPAGNCGSAAPAVGIQAARSTTIKQRIVITPDLKKVNRPEYQSTASFRCSADVLLFAGSVVARLDPVTTCFLRHLAAGHDFVEMRENGQ
jgi:hypothetical protein